MQATSDGCFVCQCICSVISLDSGMSRTIHPQEPLKMDVEQCQSSPLSLACPEQYTHRRLWRWMSNIVNHLPWLRHVQNNTLTGTFEDGCWTLSVVSLEHCPLSSLTPACPEQYTHRNLWRWILNIVTCQKTIDLWHFNQQILIGTRHDVCWISGNPEKSKTVSEFALSQCWF